MYSFWRKMTKGVDLCGLSSDNIIVVRSSYPTVYDTEGMISATRVIVERMVGKKLNWRETNLVADPAFPNATKATDKFSNKYPKPILKKGKDNFLKNC